MISLVMPRRRAGARSWFAAHGVNGTDGRALLRLAAPVAGLSLVNMAMSVTDTLMVAAFGAEALAAVAVGSDFYSILFYLALGCIGGLAPLYAAAHSDGDWHRLARLRSAGWLVAPCLALPLGAAIWCGPALFVLLGIDPALVGQGAGYTRAMALTLMPMLAVGVLRIRLTAIERPGVMLRITLAMVPLNALFNYVFMHGALGLPAIGVTGAGASSCLVACLTFAALFVLGRRHDFSGLAMPGWAEIREIMRIGLPTGIATVAEVGIYLGATIYAATLSVADAAAHSVTIRLAGVTFAVYIGLQQAAMVRVAREGGLPHRRAEVMTTSMAIGAIAGLTMFLTLVVVAHPLAAHLLAGSGGAVGIAVVLLILLALSDLAGPSTAVAAGLMRGLGDARPAMIYSLTGHWLLAAPLGVLLTAVFGMGAVGIWIALTAGSLVSSVLTVSSLRRHFPGQSSNGNHHHSLTLRHSSGETDAFAAEPRQ